MARRLVAFLLLSGACASTEGSDAGQAPEVGAFEDASSSDLARGDAASDVGGEDADAASTHGDASVDPFAHCPFAGPLPSFASHEGALVRVAAGGFDLLLQPLLGALRLAYVAPGAPLPGRSWAVLTPLAAAPFKVGADGAEVLLCTPWVAARVDSRGHLHVADSSGVPLLVDPEDGGWSSTDGTSRVVRHTPSGERFFGLGEKTGRLDKRGRRLTFWNTDAYDPDHGGFPPGQDPLYVSIPFFVGLRGTTAYGLFTDDPHRLTIDLASATTERTVVETEGGTIDQYLLLGPAIADVVKRYAALTGRSELPPRWALGYHQSRWGYSPAAKVREISAEFRARRLGADAVWLDIQHQDGFRTFTFDPAAFPDPLGLIRDLASSGFRTVVIADPGIKVDPAWSVYSAGLTRGLFLREASGQPFVGQVWPGDSVFLDFSMPEARQFWGQQVAALFDRGVRGIWLDVNEPTTFPEAGGGSSVPNTLGVAGNGAPTTMAELHNVYALLEAQATYEAIRAHPSDVRPFILSRAGYAGIQRYAAVWTGDAPSTWWSLQQVLPMLLGLSLSGVPFVGSDVGGYSGNATPELFARWIQVGAYSPFFRGHVTNGVPDQEPWAFGPEVEVISREVIEERSRLLPYWYSLFAATSSSGEPLLRPLVYEFQSDPTSATVDDQAMIGPFLLFAPVLQQGATTRSIYLPPGRWFEARSGAIYDGPITVSATISLAARPTFVRAGAILPKGPPTERAALSVVSPLTLELYPGGEPSRFVYYEDEGEGGGHRQGAHSAIAYDLNPTATGVRLTATRVSGRRTLPRRSLVVQLMRADHGAHEVRLDSRPLPERASVAELGAEGWAFDSNPRTLVVTFPDRDHFELELTYDRSIQELRPEVDVCFTVTLPPDTPATDTIYAAISALGWQHVPLLRLDATTAQGCITLPRGAWFFYKYSRGGWGTVEKWPECLEAENRYAQAAAIELSDRVFEWRDLCE